MRASDPLREAARTWVAELQDRICRALEAVDGQAQFQEDRWERPGGGGGRTRVLEDGAVFEKGGVNVSCVFGEVPPALADAMAGQGQRFWATGVSLVLHPKSPHVPTTHANYRLITRGEVAWLGGGADLTPYILYEEDAEHFHRVHREACERHDPGLYPAFKSWCDRYFYLPHRGEARGIGGLFFDHVRAGQGEAAGLDEEDLVAWWRDVGSAFLDAYLPIVHRRMDLHASDADRRWQLQRRSRYAEFNLLCDRGTRFGLETEGRVESIFMSMPPLCRFDYDVEPARGTHQERLLEVLRTPRAWAIG